MSPNGGFASTLMIALNSPPVQISMSPQTSKDVESGGHKGLTRTESRTDDVSPFTVRSATVISMQDSPILLIEIP